MSDIGALVERLVEAGFSIGEASSIIAEAVAAGAATAAYRKSPGAIRTERWREKTRHKTSQRDASDDIGGVTKRHETSRRDDECIEPDASQNVTNRHQASQCDNAPISLEKEVKKEKRGSQLPDGWRPDAVRWDAACRKLGTSVAERELNKFTAHHRAKGTVFKNWSSGWDKWLINSEQWLPKTPATTEMPSFSTPADIDWRNVLTFYKKSGIWSKWAGPDPDSPACKAPPELLREFGLLKSA